MLGDFYSKQMQYAESNFVITLNGSDVGVIMGSRRSKIARSAFIKENLFDLIVTMIKNPKFLVKKLASIIKNKESFRSKHEMRLLNILISNDRLEHLRSERGWTFHATSRLQLWGFRR